MIGIGAVERLRLDVISACGRRRIGQPAFGSMPRTGRRARLQTRASSRAGADNPLGAARLVADDEAGMIPEEYLERVRSLLPALSERARRTEELRRLPDETFADFQEQGVLRALQPKRYGGYATHPRAV